MSRDSACLNFLKRNLDREEFEIIEASTDSEAIQKNDDYPDILVLDFEAVQMSPDILVSVMRKTNPNLKIVLISGISSLEDAKAIEQGVFYYTSKPVGNAVIDVIKAGRKAYCYGK